MRLISFEPHHLRTRYLVTGCRVAAFFLMAGCSQHHVEHTGNKQEIIMREFRLHYETIVITESDMENIRRAVIDRLAREDDDPHRFLKKELEGSIAVLGSEDSRFGPWVLTDRNEQLALVRIPPRGAMNYLFVARLDRHQGHWIVTEFFQERMQAQ